MVNDVGRFKVNGLSQPETNGSRDSTPPAVRIERVMKRFESTTALAGVDLEVPEGMVFGLLGPNGAGKTTLVRILATLLEPDAGRAELVGHDVVSEAASVRELIALTGQFAAVDELLTGRENLEMFGRLLRLSRTEARAPRGGAARALRARRGRGPDGEDILRRDAPSARPGVQPAHPAPCALPRRADYRPRPPEP